MKLVMRFKAKTKRGHMQEVIDMLKEMGAANPNLKARIYSPYIGENSIVTWDVELDEPGHLPLFMERIIANDFANDLSENKWYQLTSDVVTEVLCVEE